MLKVVLLLLFLKKNDLEIHMLIWNFITCKYIKQNAIYEINANDHNLHSPCIKPALS